MSTRSKKRKTRRHGAMSSAKHKLYLRTATRALRQGCARFAPRSVI